MKFIGNILWFILTGLWAAVIWGVLGILCCITVIGIPLGLQCFKIAGFVIWPFGKEIDTDFDEHPLANIIWLILFGWELSLGILVCGILWCITIIGIPFGKQCFKLVKLCLLPFGAKVR
jgi:uncharacterized membrane protein YccF (DUF307 family)